MNLKILEMNERHLAEITSRLKDFDEFWNEKILIDEFNSNSSKYFVALDAQEVVGFGGLWFNIDESHIMNIAVRQDKRKNGIASRLLEFLIEVAKKENKDNITLEVRENNIPAIKLYQKFEFEFVGRRKKYYDNLNDAIIMTKFF